MSSSSNDNVDYNALHIQMQGFEKMLVNFTTNYQAYQLIVNHNLGYVPKADVFWDVASGDQDPDSVTATSFNGKPLPYIQYQNGFGLSAPTIYRYVYYTVDKYTIIFTVQQWGTQDGTTASHFFKYYLYSQPAVH